eukprot:5781919-Prymnesium_polylepis.1
MLAFARRRVTGAGLEPDAQVDNHPLLPRGLTNILEPAAIGRQRQISREDSVLHSTATQGAATFRRSVSPPA